MDRMCFKDRVATGDGIATGISLTEDGITRVPIGVGVGAGGGDAPVSLHYRFGISPPNPFP